MDLRNAHQWLLTWENLLDFMCRLLEDARCYAIYAPFLKTNKQTSKNKTNCLVKTLDLIIYRKHKGREICSHAGDTIDKIQIVGKSTDQTALTEKGLETCQI